MSFFLTASQVIQNYGFEIAGSTYDPVFTKGYINSSPNVSIAGSSCFIDYSECYDNSDRTTLVKMFQNTPAGTTFALSNGDYYDADVEIRRDISGVLQLETLTGNNKLIIGGITAIYTQVVGLRTDLAVLGVGRPSAFKTGRLSATSLAASHMDSAGYTTTAAINIKALSTNTDFIYIGNTAGLLGSSFGYALDPGENVSINVINTNKIFAISNTGTQVITYLAT